MITYIATPYSHPDPKVMHKRFEIVSRFAGHLMQDGEIVFSPISHTHPIACRHNLPDNWEFWEKDLSDSVKAIESIKHTILPKLISGKLHTIEEHQNELLVLIDRKSGVDYIREDDTGLQGVAARVIHGLGGGIYQGAYKGWVFITYTWGKKQVTQRLHYHHGFGGNAKRSKGILDVQIEAMKYPDADIMVRGHTHQKWYDPSTTRERVTRTGRVYTDSVKYLQLGSYKNGATDGDGWEVQKNFMPTKMGGWYLHHRLHKMQNLILKDSVTEAE